MKQYFSKIFIGLIAVVVLALVLPTTVSADWTYGGFAIPYTVTVPPPPVPTASISVSPTSVAYGGASTITWSSTNATSCTASNGWSGAVALSGAGGTGALYSSPTYTITCSGPGGSATASATVTVGVPPVPTASISVSPTSVAYGGASTITWSSTNATSCTASNGWSGAVALSGAGGTGALYSSPTYTITCSGPGGSATASATVTVGVPPVPTASISVSPTSVAYGGASTITWSSTDATSCTASNYWSGVKPLSGAGGTGALYSSPTYTITCSGPGGSATASATVTVGVPPVPTVSISVNPTTVYVGDSSYITWSSTDATSCTASNYWSGVKPLSGAGGTGALYSSPTYTITCSGPGGSATASATVNVVPKPVPSLWFSASPSVIYKGTASTLYWAADNVTSCTAGGDWSGSKVINSNQSTGTLNSVRTYTYTLSCTGQFGTVNASTYVIVIEPPVVITMPAIPPIDPGQAAVITYSVQNATSCIGSGSGSSLWDGVRTVPSGSVPTGIITKTTTYTLSCTGLGNPSTTATTVVITGTSVSKKPWWKEF